MDESRRTVGIPLSAMQTPLFPMRQVLQIALLTYFSALALSAESRPNILFCIADDWGWPHAGAYGDRVVQTPHFDRIAREGLLFQHAFISAPSCTPSRNAILTGRNFWELGAGSLLWSNLPQDLETYPQLLAQTGYFTGHYRKSYGPGKLEGKWAKDHPAGQHFDSFQDFLAARPAGKPFAFWLGTSDPHRPYRKGSGVASGMNLADVQLFPHFPPADEIRSDVADYYWEVQRWDGDVGDAMALLEERGELDNTIVVMTGDHGMPFPRAKGNLYDAGSRVPLAIRWPEGLRHPGRQASELVSLIDLAPTFLEAAGAPRPSQMTGESFMDILEDRVGDERSYDAVYFGKERHVPAQELPSLGGYPMRGIRTQRFLYILNEQPESWPVGTPDWRNASIRGTWFGDTDGGPTKDYIVENRHLDPAHAFAYDLCFGKRPVVELYDLANDPHQLYNVANSPAYAVHAAELRNRLQDYRRETGDPRLVGGAQAWLDVTYRGGGPRHPGYRIDPSAPGWEDLFAPDLSNADYNSGIWTFVDGELTATEDQVIWTKDDYENFIIDLDFKTGPAANSGVIIYCSDTRNWIPNSVEIQILDDHSPKWADVDDTWRCGGMFGHLAPTKMAVKQPGEWNHMTIVARGPIITVELNGQLVAPMDMRRWTSASTNPDGSPIPPWLSTPFAELPTRGKIGLQGKHGGAPIWFRNLRIKRLDSAQ